MDKDNIVQNLQDAGCGSLLIDEFFRLKNLGKNEELFSLLSKHRAKLLESLFENQKKIDCLDFLIFNMKK